MPFFMRNNAKIYFEDHGRGEPIIAVHGLIENTTYWKNVAEEVRRGYRFISMDMRGHGQTIVDREPYGFDVDTIGDDIDALMILCRADITSKNLDKVNKYLRNFDLVEQKIVEVEQKDHIRNFQPPVSGDEIMKMFQLPPGRIIGEIKEQIKEAILEGEIRNDRDEAMELLMKIAQEKGLISDVRQA